MCMLSFFPEGVIPNRDNIENGAGANPDGHGFAVVTRDRRLLIEKSMDAERLIERFMQVRTDNPDGPAMFHSRIATSGLVDITGCHPFKVGSDNRTAVGHNGILFSPPKTSTRSDTRIFAESILPRYGSLDKARTMRKLEKYTGSYNKLVILTVNPARRQTAYLINEKAGYWTQGEWHSNMDYLGYSGYSCKSGKSSNRQWWDEVEDEREDWTREPWPCDLCDANYAVDTMTLVCAVCRSCNDCHMYVEECQCFTPQAVKSAEQSARVFESHLSLGTQLVPASQLYAVNGSKKASVHA